MILVWVKYAQCASSDESIYCWPTITCQQLLLPPQIHANPDSIPIVSFNNFPAMLMLGFPENFRDALNSPIPFLQLIERMPFLKKPDDFWVFKAGSLPACLPKCPHIYLPTCLSACLRPSAGTIGPSSLFILFWHLMSFEVQQWWITTLVGGFSIHYSTT